MKRRKVIIIGAGLGGLSAGMILASKGYDVQIFEKQEFIGGRNSSFNLNGYKFDIGTTFLMMKHIIDDLFNTAGRQLEDYLELIDLDPIYRLVFTDKGDLIVTRDKEAMVEQIRRLYPGNERGYRRFFKYEKTKYERLMPCLCRPFESYVDLFRKEALRAIPYFDLHKSLYRHTGRYFRDENLRLAFTFHGKYLGMSPWECPGTFSIIPYVEHALGIHHPIGGLNRLSKAMADVIHEEGGRIYLSTPVKEILVRNKRAVGVLLENGEKLEADEIVINADFSYAMTHLIKSDYHVKYTPEVLEAKRYSCSAFMLYLGVNRTYNIPHHNIIFASDYKKNVDEITSEMLLSEDPSFYIQNATITDPSLASEGHASIYVLVPVPNNSSGINWDDIATDYREKILDLIETRGGLKNIRKHIQCERMITPSKWEKEMNVYRGAIFGLAHSVDQMLLWRPHNRFEELDNCFLVGGGTHPGSGIPTIIMSGIISASLIMQRGL